MVRFITVVLILAASGFFNPLGTVSPQLSKFIYYGCALYGLLFFPVKTQVFNRLYPMKPYRMIIFGIIGAVVMATLFQEQSVSVSLMAVLPYLFGYLSFLVFMKSGMDEDAVKRLIAGLLCCSLFVYVVNFVTFPVMIFGNKDADNIDMSRGVMRIDVQYIDLFILSTFYGINQWLLSKKKKWLIVIGVSGLMIVLSVTRQVIGITAIMGTLFLLKRLPFYKKAIFVVLMAIFVTVFLPKIPIYQALVETTENQIERNDQKEDVRIREARFYSDEYQTNIFTRFLGNGIPSIGNSRWGNKFEMDISYYGYYSSDIGWIGFYWHFGLIAVVGVFIFLLKGAMVKKTADREYLTYYCYSIILLSVMSAPILIYTQIIDIMLVLYLIFRFQNGQKITRYEYERKRIYCIDHS